MANTTMASTLGAVLTMSSNTTTTTTTTTTDSCEEGKLIAYLALVVILVIRYMDAVALRCCGCR